MQGSAHCWSSWQWVKHKNNTLLYRINDVVAGHTSAPAEQLVPTPSDTIFSSSALPNAGASILSIGVVGAVSVGIFSVAVVIAGAWIACRKGSPSPTPSPSPSPSRWLMSFPCFDLQENRGKMVWTWPGLKTSLKEGHAEFPWLLLRSCHLSRENNSCQWPPRTTLEARQKRQLEIVLLHTLDNSAESELSNGIWRHSSVNFLVVQAITTEST